MNGPSAIWKTVAGSTSAGVGPSDEPDPLADQFDDQGAWRVPPPWPIAPGPSALSAEVREALVAAIARLPAGQRAVIELRDMEGRGAADVCRRLDLSDASQRVLLHHARTALRSALAATLEPRAT